MTLARSDRTLESRPRIPGAPPSARRPRAPWSRGLSCGTHILCVAALASVLAGASAALAQPALIQSALTESVQTDLASVALSSPPTPGNVLVAFCGTATAQTLDSISPGWQIAIDESANGPGLAILYKVADPGDTVGLTIRYSAGTRLGVQLLEYSGIDTALPIQAVASSSGSDVAPQTGSVTTLVPDERVVAGIVALTDEPVSGWTGGFAQIQNFVTGQPPRAPSTHTAADRLATAPGTYSSSVNIAGRKARWRGQIVALNPTPAVSVRVTNGTFSFGTQPPDIWLTPESTLVINDGRVTENFLCRVSPFTDGVNVWTVDPTINGPDQIQAQWSTTGSSGTWTGLAAYDTDFILATGVAAGDTVVFHFRIRTPASTSSFNNHAAGVTITAEAN